MNTIKKFTSSAGTTIEVEVLRRQGCLSQVKMGNLTFWIKTSRLSPVLSCTIVSPGCGSDKAIIARAIAAQKKIKKENQKKFVKKEIAVLEKESAKFSNNSSPFAALKK